MTVGRIAAGVSPATVSAELESIAAALAAEHPALYADFGGAANFVIDVEPLRDAIADSPRASLWLLFGAVALVLVIGCVNAAQFLLSHAIEREPEVALRSAVGASRGRLVAQFLSETMVLVAAAAGLGGLQAVWLVGALRSILPGMLLVGRIELDLSVLAFTGAISVTTMLMCGVVPALRFARTRLRASLDPRTVVAGGRGRARQILVAIQVALSIVLVIQAGLLVRTLQVLLGAQSGFSADGVTAMRIRGMGAGAALGVTYEQFLDRIAAVPGGAVAAMTGSVLPGWPSTPYSVVGRPVDAGRPAASASYQIVSPDYFSVLRIPLRAGRTFAPTDTATAAAVAVVNDELVRQHWPGESPLGRQVRAGAGPRDATMTIVGVVGDVRAVGQTADVPQIYVSYLQQAEPNMVVLVRPQAAPLSVDAVKRAIWTVEPRQAVFDVQALDVLARQSLQGGRTITLLLGGIAALAVMMAMAGAFAAVSYLTSRRQKEVALRRAIGAGSGDVLWLLAAPTFRWTLAGLAVGLAGAVVASRLLAAVTPNLVTLDAALVAPLGAGYLAAIVAALVLPAARALRVDLARTLNDQQGT
jgi:predicted permease